MANYSCLENPMNSIKRQKDRTLKDEPSRSVGVQYATGDQWKTNSRKNEEIEPRQKQHPVVDVTGDVSKVLCCKEQYCVGTWNVRSMNQGKLEVVKEEMARIDILGSDQISRSVVSDSLRPHESQHTRPPCPSPTPGVHSDHVHLVSDTIQPSHPLSSPSPAPNPSQHHSLFQ